MSNIVTTHSRSIARTYKSYYSVVKTFGHDLGLSTAFRQWRAGPKSHCRFIHGYALAIELTFCAPTLDARNWVINFGEFKELKLALQDKFDHKTVVAEDDPDLEFFREGSRIGVFDLVVVPHVGCECFAELIYDIVETWLTSLPHHGVTLSSVKVSEHGANSATYRREYV